MTTTAIRHRGGTFRAVGPRETWDGISPDLMRFGITRVADITLLDEIGIPTWVAYRPDSKTLSVSIGTGLDPMQARVSAAMESIEAWHVENPACAAAFRGSASDIDLPYDVRSINLAPHSPVTSRSALEWTMGKGVLTRRAIPVPLDSIRLDFTGNYLWNSALFFPTTNGVATGSTPLDATLHGMCELMERDCTADHELDSPSEIRYCDVDESQSSYVGQIVARLRSAGCVIAVWDISNRLDVPCYSAWVWSPDVPIYAGGYGCHIDSDIALGRALLEAAQSRLAVISGARDDIDAGYYHPRGRVPNPPADQFVPLRTTHADGLDLEAAVRYCAERIAEVTGIEPVTVDLAHDDIGIPAQKVYAPGLRMYELY